jgi:hypothetical protein
MGGGGGSTKTTTTIDPFLKPYVKDVLEQAKKIYNQPMAPQTDPTKLIAKPGETMQQYKQGASNITAGTDTLGKAQAGIEKTAAGVAALPAYEGAKFDPRVLTSNQIREYMNPYQQQVIDTAMADEARRAGQERADLTARQANIRSLGGSRGSVESAILQDNQARRAATLEAELLNKGYDAASALALSQQKAQAEADAQTEASRQFAEGANMDRSKFGLQAASQLSDAAARERDMEIQRLQGLKDVGVMDQALEQRLLDLREAQKQYAENYQKLQLSDLAAMVYGAPAGSQTTQSGGGQSFGTSLMGAALYGLGSL